LSTLSRPPSRLVCPNWCGNWSRSPPTAPDVNELRRENAELRQQVGYWKAMHARAVQRAELLESELAQLRGENRTLQGQLFGRKSERASSQPEVPADPRR
jgi:hypothetical protein